MQKPKEYKTTSKIDYAFIKCNAMERLANIYVAMDKHARAVTTFTESERLRVKAWNFVYELYPGLKDGTAFTYFRYEHVIRIAKEN